MIDRIYLSILNEIDQKKTLTAAAQALCLTQPALTHRSIGPRLWQKDGHGLIRSLNSSA
ncbi:helix-turn-helix domain-containing protein [Desulfobacter hydrogenophilus]|uniref:helix-turn-helix domain-containing protein n=1 Tax=Desulfobacter hydrogenophilus TaxID=2291 RepID=UPI001A94709B|nr:LysR family transcriptional regulator [Desulfobacter hydrogenophilus]